MAFVFLLKNLATPWKNPKSVDKKKSYDPMTICGEGQDFENKLG